MAKVRVYSFTAYNTENDWYGVYEIAAKSKAEAQRIQWEEIHNGDGPYECYGYVGIKSLGWREEARGFIPSPDFTVHGPPHYVKVRSAYSGALVWERADTPWESSVASDAYWQK